MAEPVVIRAAAGQIVGREHGKVIPVRDKVIADAALRRVGVSRLRNSVDRVHARRVIGVFHDAQAVVLAQEGLRVLEAGFDVVGALGIGVIGVNPGVGQGAELPDRRGFEIRGPQIGERMGAGEVIVEILSHKGAQVED